MSEPTEANTQSMEATETGNPEAEVQAPKKQSPVGRVIFLAITAACFAYLYYRQIGRAHV